MLFALSEEIFVIAAMLVLIFCILPVIFIKVRDLPNQHAGFKKYMWEYVF
jgi:hypothetical protein